MGKYIFNNYFKYLIGKLGIRNLIEANKYKGRGYVQITGRTNYEKFSLILQDDFITNPTFVLLPEIAYKIMIYGFVNGSSQPTYLCGHFRKNQYCST